MEAWHKSNIWDVATTAGVYITRARTGFSTHYAVSIIYIYTYRCGFDTAKTWNVSVDH